MVAPVNRLPVSPPPAKVSRATVRDDTAFEALAAVRRLLGSDDPKVVLAAAKIVLEFEKDRTRKIAKLGYDPLAEQFDDVPVVPQVSDPEPAPAPTARTEPEAEPETRPAPRFDPPSASLVVTANVRGGKPSVASFLPTKLTGGQPVAPAGESG